MKRSFRGDAKHRTRNLEIPGLRLASRNDGGWIASLFRSSQFQTARQILTRFKASRRAAPELCIYLPPKEGVGNAGCPLHPRPRVHLVLVERTRVTTSTPELPGIPARNGFNGFLRALVSAKSGRMCERAVLTNRPSLDLSPFVLEGQEPAGERGTGPVSSSTRTVAWA